MFSSIRVWNSDGIWGNFGMAWGDANYKNIPNILVVKNLIIIIDIDDWKYEDEGYKRTMSKCKTRLFQIHIG